METILRNFDLVPFDLAMIAVGAVLFVGLWQVLKVALFQPYLSLIEAREAATVGAEARARANDEKAANLLKDYEDKLMEERVAALKVKTEALIKAKAEAVRIIKHAEGEAQLHLEKVRQEIVKELATLEQSRAVQAEALGVMMADKVKRLLASPDPASAL